MTQLTIPQAFDLAVRHYHSGQPQQAELLCRQILAHQPNHADVLHLLGVIAYHAGQREMAADLITRAIASRPNYPEAHTTLGVVLSEMGRLDDAIATYRQAISLKPDYPDPYNNLGNALRATGRLDEAIAAFRQAIFLRPDYSVACNNLGNALKDRGQLDEAIAAYRHAIWLKPDYPDPHNNLGNALREKGQLDEAAAACRQAISLRPAYPEAHSNLGNALKDKGQLNEAIASFRQAIVLKPDYPEAHNNLGVTLHDNHQLDEAVAAFRQAIALKPNYAEAHNNLGHALCDLGQFSEATDCYRRALAIRPAAQFYRSLVSAGRQVADSAEARDLTGLVHQPGLPVDDVIDAEFALGKLLDEAGRFDEAFAHFAAGNRLLVESRAAAGTRFDGEELRRLVNQTIQTFTPAFFASRSRWGDASQLPVFIVGMPRSGTSLVEQIAASHPAVFGAGELEKIQQLSAALHGEPDHTPGSRSGGASPAAWTAESLAKASSTYLEHVCSLGGAAMRVTDKMPANVFHLGLIALLLPSARVIFCRRDPRDTCLSCYFERFTRNNLLYTYDLLDCARQYLETERLTAHWLKTLPLPMLEIHYETLVTDQEGQSRRLIDFLGLPWDPACLAFHRTKRPVMTASAWQVRQPIYTRSMGRWRHYQRHLGLLLATLQGLGHTSPLSPQPSAVDPKGLSLPKHRASQERRPQDSQVHPLESRVN